MASIVTFVLCFLVCSMIFEARSQGFVTVECQTPDVAQYGNSTLLNCVVKPRMKPYVEIDIVTWATSGRQAFLVFHEGKIVADDPNIQFAHNFPTDRSMNVSILIKNTDLSHTGEYTCRVITEGGEAETTLELTVKSTYSQPKITSDLEKISPDKEGTLTCRSDRGFPAGDIKWVVNDAPWKTQPKVEIEKDSNGLYKMTSKLSFDPNMPFTTFACDVYNAKGERESRETFHKPELRTDPDTKDPRVTQIVAPAVVIGSLIVGLLAAILMCRRRRQNVPTQQFEEEQQMYTENP